MTPKWDTHQNLLDRAHDMTKQHLHELRSKIQDLLAAGPSSLDVPAEISFQLASYAQYAAMMCEMIAIAQQIGLPKAGFLMQFHRHWDAHEQEAGERTTTNTHAAPTFDKLAN